MKCPWPDLDDVVEIGSGTIHARRATSIAEDFYEYHFPLHPIVPAVLMLSWLEHAGGVLVAHRTSGRLSAMLREMSRVTCLRAMSPGDVLALKLETDLPESSAEAEGDAVRAVGAISCGDNRVLRARLVLEIVRYDGSSRPWGDVEADLGLPPAAERRDGR